MKRMVACSLTASNRVFVFCSADTIADSTTVMFALHDAVHFSVLSSRQHITWATNSGSRLGVGNDPRYNKSRCFDPFPFPDADDSILARLRDLGEQLDAHRKARQAAHPKLTLTQMYNVLEKLRAGEVIEGKDKEVYEQGLIGILNQLHDEIDAAVAEAYGWPVDLPEEELLFRLVELNAERVEEEPDTSLRRSAV